MPSVDDCPGILWIYDQPSTARPTNKMYCVLHDVRDRHSCLTIPVVKTPAGIVQRIIWTLWTVASEEQREPYTSCLLESSISGTRLGRELVGLKQVERVDPLQVAREADVAHYTSMGGIFDILHEDKMASSLSPTDKRLFCTLHAVSVVAALKVLATTEDKSLAHLKPIATAHTKMLVTMKVDVAPIERLRNQICASIKKMCEQMLKVCYNSFMHDTFVTLEQMGFSSLVSAHLSKARCYVSHDMSTMDDKQRRLIATYQKLCKDLSNPSDSVNLVSNVARVLLTAALHNGDIGRGLGLYGVAMQRADETGVCAVCGDTVPKIQLALGSAHICPHDNAAIVCGKCGVDMGCVRCKSATVEWSRIAINTVCDNMLMALKLTNCEPSAAEISLRRELDETKSTLRDLRLASKKERRKGRARADPSDAATQTDALTRSVASDSVHERMTQTTFAAPRTIKCLALIWLAKTLRRNLSEARTQNGALSERVRVVESKLSRHTALCATLRSTLELVD